MYSSVDPGAPVEPLPARVADELGRRRRQALGRARGLVLDLDLEADRDTLARVMAAPAEAIPLARYDTIVSTGALTAWPDLHAAAVALDRLLADDGELLVVEPVDRPGLVGLSAATLGALLPVSRGRHLARDVVATLRSVGLTVADVDRFTVSTPAWPLRRWVDARLVRIPRRVPAVAAGGEP